MDIEWHRRARVELDDAADHYEIASEGLGNDFLAEIEWAVEQIRSFPNAWPIVSRKSRRIRTKRFPYGIVYQRIGDRLVILAVMHLHRRPDYWRDRET